jgi:hypothetical protein
MYLGEWSRQWFSNWLSCEGRGWRNRVLGKIKFDGCCCCVHVAKSSDDPAAMPVAHCHGCVLCGTPANGNV